MKKSLLLILGLIVALATTFAQPSDYSFAEEYPASEGFKLAVSTFDGNVEVLPADGNSVTVYYKVFKDKRLLDITRPELEDDLDIFVESTNNQLTLEIENKRRYGWYESMYVSLTIYTPTSTSSEIHTSDGNIYMENLNGEQQLETSDGNVSANRIGSDLSIRTSDGNIEVRRIEGELIAITSDGNVEADQVAGDVEIRTSDGNIDLTDATGEVYLKTSDGNIFFEGIYGSVKATTSDGDIRGTINELTNDLVLSTGDGDINATILRQDGIDLSMRGNRVKVDPGFVNFDGDFDDRYVRGRMNGGGYLVDLKASDGSVTLHY